MLVTGDPDTLLSVVSKLSCEQQKSLGKGVGKYGSPEQTALAHGEKEKSPSVLS